MSAAYDLPTENDFHEAMIIRFMHPQNAHFSIEQFRKGKINMKMVVDFREFNENFVVFDDSKNEEYSKSMEEWQKAINSGGQVTMGQTQMSVSTPPPQPQPPVINKKYEGTVLVYMNGQERVINTKIEDWEQEYFEYLTKKKVGL
jgi:hypothetical protein